MKKENKLNYIQFIYLLEKLKKLNPENRCFNLLDIMNYSQKVFLTQLHNEEKVGFQAKLNEKEYLVEPEEFYETIRIFINEIINQKIELITEARELKW